MAYDVGAGWPLRFALQGASHPAPIHHHHQPTMTDFRALCAAIICASDAVGHDASAAEGDFLAAIDNARAALAQPELRNSRTPIMLLRVGASCGGGAHLTPDQCHCILTLLATPLAGP